MATILPFTPPHLSPRVREPNSNLILNPSFWPILLLETTLAFYIHSPTFHIFRLFLPYGALRDRD